METKTNALKELEECVEFMNQEREQKRTLQSTELMDRIIRAINAIYTILKQETA